MTGETDLKENGTDAGSSVTATPASPAPVCFFKRDIDNQALAAWRLGLAERHDEAVAILQDVLKREPGHAAAHAYMATIMIALGKYDDVVPLLKEAARLGGRAEKVLAQITGADLHLKVNRNDLARNDLERAFPHVNEKTPAPWASRAWYNLARLFRAEDNNDAMLQAANTAASLDEHSVPAAFILGEALNRNGDAQKALSAFRHVIALGGDNAALYNAMGCSLTRLNAREQAAKAFGVAINLDPDMTVARNNLGNLFFQMGRHDEAIEQLEAVLRLDPGNAFAGHTLASLKGTGDGAAPERANDDYVKVTFDNFADTFDTKLVERLGYRGPEQIAEQLARILPEAAAQFDILDAGCGTGLCGPLLKPWAARLTGVDLSPRMLKKAETRSVYDHLEEAELTAWLQARPMHFDVIVAADVLVYFGDLDALAAATATALKTGGVWAFTVENFTDPDQTGAGWHLNPHGRYSHARGYLETVATAHGLEIVEAVDTILRKEGHDEVASLGVVMRKRDKA